MHRCIWAHFAGLNQCILLDLSGEGDRGSSFDFDANWDRYFLQAKSNLECDALDEIDACLADLPNALEGFVASFGEADDGAVAQARSDCAAAVDEAYACVSAALDGTGCADEWVTRVIDARNANDIRTCQSTEMPEVAQPTPLQTSCSSSEKFPSAEACSYECCELDYSGAESRCTILKADGTVAEASDDRMVACMAEAWSIREQCTERCLRARPFSSEGSIAVVRSFPLDAANLLHGDAALLDATAGLPPSGFVDVEVTLSFEHALGANWSAVESATSRAAVISSCAEVYGMNSDRIGLEFSAAAGGASVIRVVERQSITDANSVEKFGDASASKYNIASPEDAVSLPATVPFACAAIAGKSGDYLAVFQTATAEEATPCGEHATQLEELARQCMSSAPTTGNYECLMNATSEGHDILTNSGTADCSARKAALVAALNRFAPGFPVALTCERADGKSVLRVGDCAGTVALLTELTASAAAGGFAGCKSQDTRSLAQSVFEDFQAGVASAASNTMHFPPLAAAGHHETLVRRLSGRIPSEFDPTNGKGLFFAAMRMEWSPADVDDALVTIVPPPVYYDFDALTEDGGNITLVDGAAGLDGANGGATDVSNLASNLAASTSSGDEDDDAKEANSTLSTGVLAFAIIVPLFIIGILVYVAVQHKKHRKVHVVPTGLSFKQPAAMQSLPNRGIPNYKDRTMQDVRSNALNSMPSTNGASDPFGHTLPKRLSSAGTRLPPVPKSHDPFGAAKTKADGPDPFGDFN